MAGHVRSTRARGTGCTPTSPGTCLQPTARHAGADWRAGLLSSADELTDPTDARRSRRLGAPLVGRTEEAALIRSLLDQRRPVLLGGHAGVGKTRLASELATAWAAEGWAVEWMTASGSSAALPFGAVVRLVPDVVDSSGSLGREAALLRTAVAEVRQAPTRLLVIDDVHELDDLSALLLHHLVLDRGAPILLTARSGDPLPVALDSISHDGHIERIDVLPLSARESRSVAEALVDGPIAPTAASGLFAASGGNPLLLGELIHDALEAGSLRLVDEAWHWDGRVGRALHVRDAVVNRLARVPEPERKLVTALALAEPLSADSLREAVPDADVVAAERRGLITVRQQDQRLECRVAHPLIGEVLVEQCDANVLSELRRDLADVIAATGARRHNDALLEAQLRLDAGDEISMELLRSAVTDATLRGGAPIARQLAEAAIRGGAPIVARVLLAETLIGQRDPRGAIDILEAVLDDLDAPADITRAAQALQHAYLHLDDFDGMARSIERAQTLVSDPTWSAVLDGYAIQSLFFFGRSGEASARGEALLARHDDPRVRLRLLTSVGMGRAIAGRTEDASALVNELFPAALQLQDELPLAPSWVGNVQVLALGVGGRLDSMTALIDMLRSPGISDHEPWLDLISGWVDLARGNAARAAVFLGTAADAFGRDDLGGFYAWARSLQAEALALTGAFEAACSVAEESRWTAPSRARILDGHAARARAWVTAAGGELSRAIDELIRAAEGQRLEGQHGFEALSLHDAVRLGALADAGPLLDDILPGIDGLWAEAMVMHLRALRSGSGSDFESAGEAFAAMGACLHAAEAFADAARAHQRDQLRSRVATAARRRDEMLARCGPVRTPALHDGPAAVALTRREREVAELVGRGLSNRAVADALFISVRTAEGHLHNAMGKLGVSNRENLAEILGTNR